MASADMREELTCPVCMDIFTNPVALACGHSFCKKCVSRTWDNQDETEYPCPECRQRFRVRPKLKRNLRLSNIVDSFLCSEPAQKKVEIACTYCDSPVPAAKTCLLCETSLCENHLQKHSKSEEHILIEPTNSPENRKCSVHKKVLEYYCCEDAACICINCRLDGGHRGHQVETLTEASEKKKEKLRIILKKMSSERAEVKKSVQNLHKLSREVEGDVPEIAKQVRSLIWDIKERLKALKNHAWDEIIQQNLQVLDRILDQIQQLEIKKEDLSRKMGPIKELCNMTDPLTVLQKEESDLAPFSYAEERDSEKRVSHDKTLHDVGEIDVDLISVILHTGLASIVTDLKEQLDISDNPGMFLDVIQSSDTVPDISILPEFSVDEYTNSTILLGIDKGYDITLIENDTSNILMDVRTAGNDVFVSDDFKDLHWSEINRGRPERPERFEGPQVLSSMSFSSGIHYWEVEVSDSGEWSVGMAYPSIARRGYQSWIGHNSKSWGLLRCHDNVYYVRRDMRVIPLPKVPSSQRLGIYLDYETGLLVFYELCEPKRQLHIIMTPFTEPLHAVFWVGRRGWVRIRSHEN